MLSTDYVPIITVVPSILEKDALRLLLEQYFTRMQRKYNAEQKNKCECVCVSNYFYHYHATGEVLFCSQFFNITTGNDQQLG